MANLISDDMKNTSIKLSHHEKRSLAWKILIISLVFFSVMLFGGIVHVFTGTVDATLSIIILILASISIAMFGLGYLIRDSLPRRMGMKCKRFHYMKYESGFWHWNRARIYLADIFLVGLPLAVYGWAASHTIPLLISGINFFDTVSFMYFNIFYAPFLWQFLAEGGLILVTVFGIVYELKTWILGKKADFCMFEGAWNTSPGLFYDCDPSDLDCQLNANIP